MLGKVLYCTSFTTENLFRSVVCSEKRKLTACLVCVVNQECGFDEWTCQDGSCIPQDRVCDRHYDCPDYSDEDRCPGIGEKLMFYLCLIKGLSMLQDT